LKRIKLEEDITLQAEIIQPDAIQPRKQRVKREDRERQITEEAIKFFAQVGFSGETRELARRIGVNQSVLYRFFENKESLIERVYQEIFITSWNPYWDKLLADRSKCLLDRLIEYYIPYSHNVITYEWVRLFLFAGLRGTDLNLRLIEYINLHVLYPIVRELRFELGISSNKKSSISEIEKELVAGINADIFYLGVRKYVYGEVFTEEIDLLVKAKVTAGYYGAKEALRLYSTT